MSYALTRENTAHWFLFSLSVFFSCNFDFDPSYTRLAIIVLDLQYEFEFEWSFCRFSNEWHEQQCHVKIIGNLLFSFEILLIVLFLFDLVLIEIFVIVFTNSHCKEELTSNSLEWYLLSVMIQFVWILMVSYWMIIVQEFEEISKIPKNTENLTNLRTSGFIFYLFFLFEIFALIQKYIWIRACIKWRQWQRLIVANFSAFKVKQLSSWCKRQYVFLYFRSFGSNKSIKMVRVFTVCWNFLSIFHNFLKFRIAKSSQMKSVSFELICDWICESNFIFFRKIFEEIIIVPNMTHVDLSITDIKFYVHSIRQFYLE